ncbi:Hsp20/alpha crystallin family protein [Dictyocaulus viviparus]|uniref:Hsp20/alpha crystallin family protein n=1 Tax=Dictyocaulus viviparus TaxID=29172 RepID=A0A0D8XRP5_DICVI|nr:Hsp20/alpha crystallin family protein [Dictyocaulus viviparus]
MYWREPDQTVLDVANEAHETSDEKEFAVLLDVSQFRPDELKIYLDGRELIIEGKQHQEDKDSSMNISFVRKWNLPENVDIDALQNQLDDKGHLHIEASKFVNFQSRKKSIPILRMLPNNRKISQIRSKVI